MTEYISKEQSVEVVNTAFEHIYDSDSETVSLVDLQNEIVMTIEQHTEPADVAPVVHGRWVYEDVDFICSNCGTDAPTEGDYRQVRSNYCPCCGAIMDGEEK